MERAYYAIIPANVRYDKDLQPNAKLLFAEITALCNDKGYCWASNKYFADLYGVSDRCVRNWIQTLVDKEYIFRQVQYKPNSKQIEKRVLSLNPTEKNFLGCGKNVPEPLEKNFRRGTEKNFLDNNKDINNKTNNKNEYIKKTTKKETIQGFVDALEVSTELKEALVGFVEMRKQMKKPLTINAIKQNLKTLDKLAIDDETKTDIVNQTIEHGWLTFYPLKTIDPNKEKTREEMGYAF